VKVVLDTNVVVSAFLSPAGTPAVIVRLVLKGDLDICINTALLAEYEQVLVRSKFSDKIHHSDIQRFIEIIHNIGTKIDAVPSQTDFIDEADRKFYDVAMAADALLITGNKKHYPMEPFILEPAAFLKIHMNESR